MYIHKNNSIYIYICTDLLARERREDQGAEAARRAVLEERWTRAKMLRPVPHEHGISLARGKQLNVVVDIQCVR